jgi:hypothetical protein
MAALSLPGLVPLAAHAATGDTVSTQYGFYQEGSRDLGGVQSKFRPIQAESTQTTLNFTLNESVKGSAGFSQDTWSGATPVATAPLSAHGNRVSATHVMTGASMDMVHGGHDMDMGDGSTASTPAQTLSGASPYLYTSLKLDAQHRPLQTDVEGNVIGGVDRRLVQTMSSASPEVRKQFDINLEKMLERSSLRAGAGTSQERDFESYYGHAGGSWDFDRKLTTLTAGLSYTYSKTYAILDHDAVPHVYEPYMLAYERRGDTRYNPARGAGDLSLGEHGPTVTGTRNDWGGSLGLTRILNKSALLESSLGLTQSRGYQSNPYKAVEVAFVDPAKQEGQAGGNSSADYFYDAEVVALMEQRPDLRNQGNMSLRYVQHVAATDAALHLGYRYYQDDWGIRAHTFETEWVQPVGEHWSVTPRVRYYSQSAADFYTPYLITDQGLYSKVTDPVYGAIYLDPRAATSTTRYYEDRTGTVAPGVDSNPASATYNQPIVGSNGGALVNRDTGQAISDKTLANALTQDTRPFDRSKLPAHYSSDARLAAYGTLSAGLVLARQFDKGMRIELGYERTQRASRLKLGGDGNSDYADYGSYLVNLGLTIDLDAVSAAAEDAHAMHAAHGHHGMQMNHGNAPAGVMMDHMLDTQGGLMVGYRFAYVQQQGDILSDGKNVNDYTLINKGCGSNACYVRPTTMDMRMHMFDIMYAVTDRLTLMLMPQFMEMDMSMRLLDGSPRKGGMDDIGMAITHAEHAHTTAGLGDTEAHALFSLFRGEQSELHMGLGVSIPTGDVDLRMRPMMALDMGFMEYGMQLGSGTWDFKPSLTWTGWNGPLAYGAQLSSTMRLQSENRSGYALGDVMQTTAWGSYGLGGGWSASLRGLYTDQGAIKGDFDGTHVRIGPGDYTGNYGGRFMDVGVGLSADVGSGSLAGSRWSLEWLMPVSDRGNGYQLERKGSLVFYWGLHW